MKKLLLISLLTFFACQTKEGNSSNTEPVNFDWLVGNWKRSNEKEDRETYESWTKVNPHKYLGTSFTIKDHDTIWQENVELVENANEWNFVVSQKDVSQPTSFKLSAIKSGAFTCENHTNEFPKIIRYRKDGDKLMAEIEGGDMKIPFEFERISN